MEKEQQFDEILAKMRESAHGSQHLGELSQLMKKLKKKKREFLASRFIIPATTWDENKEKGIWENDSEAEKNIYWFLQGYWIESTHVLGPAGKEDHQDWLVLSVDCDCVRSPFINLGKIYQISDDDEDDKRRLSLASTFKTTKYFPIPPTEERDNWSIVDLETPYFIENENSQFTNSVCSLSINAWHILNAVLQEKHTRALNIAESEKLRG